MTSRVSPRAGAGPWTFVVFIVLTFYTLGAGYLESFVNYPLWHIIGETDRWTDYHRALGPRIAIVLALPVLILSPIANVLLFFVRPRRLPPWTIWATLVLLLVAIVSTLVIQIPIQMQLDTAYDRAAVDRLIATSLWLRDLVGGGRAIIAGYMLHRVLMTADVTA
jgi:hypothetical protein